MPLWPPEGGGADGCFDASTTSRECLLAHVSSVDSLPAMQSASECLDGDLLITDQVILGALEGERASLDLLIRASIGYLNRKLWARWESVLQRWPESDLELFISQCITKALGDDLRNLQQFRDKIAPVYLKYLWTTANNAMIDYKRGPEKRSHLTDSLDEKIDPSDDDSPEQYELYPDLEALSPSESAVLAELGEELNSAIESALSKEEAILVRMWSVGHPIPEIAQAIGRTHNATSIAKYRALQKLRDYFDSRAVDHG